MTKPRGKHPRKTYLVRWLQKRDWWDSMPTQNTRAALKRETRKEVDECLSTPKRSI